MTLLSFSENARYNFVMQFVSRSNASILGIKANPHTAEIEVENPIVARLIQRIRDNESVVFPYISGTHHSWLITAPTRHQLDQTVTRVSSFLVPTFATFVSENNQRQFKRFESEVNDLQRLGGQFYPEGYYSLRAPAQQFEVILHQLELWMDLEEEQPNLQKSARLTYHSLNECFQTAVAATNWGEAEQTLYEMQRLHLITADNVAFLQIQLLAQQQRWQDIWQHPDFTYITRIRIPKLIRAALLTAFYTCVILPLEYQGAWDNALETFRQNRSQLGLLLTGRFGLTQTAVIHTFAYQAALDKDHDTLEYLETLAESELTLTCLRHLQRNVTQKSPALSTSINSKSHPQQAKQPITLQLVRQALIEQNYDEAIQHAQELETLTEKAIILMQIAFYNSDVPLAEDALLTYLDIPEEERKQLELRRPYLRSYISYLADLTKYTTETVEVIETEIDSSTRIDNWLSWFDRLKAEENQKIITLARDHLLANPDSSVWQPEMIEPLAEKLLEFLLDEYFGSITHQKIVLQYFINIFLQDPNFPHTDERYANLYETLYEGIRYKLDANQTTGLSLLRLAEAMLRQAPQKSEKVFIEIQKWCPTPIPALENWFLEVLDLLAEYGLPAGMLISWYREWLSSLLELPSNRERVKLQTWQQFGTWIKPDAGILRRLEEALQQTIQEGGNDAITDLPVGYRIGIMTLRDTSAQRVKRMLLERNDMLDIRICSETDLSDQVKSVAQNSDMVVVVTTCITHAITYGINPYINGKPVYPRSSGSSSIMSAIEQRAREITA